MARLPLPIFHGLRPLLLLPSQPMRPFSTTAILPRKDIPHPRRLAKNKKPLPPPEMVTQPPPYPFGRRTLYKQSNTGLYGLARPQYGNNIAEKYGNKSRRRWKVNLHNRRLYSFALSHWVKTKVTTRVLRTVDKLGGLDNYLLGTKSARIRELGPHGWMLRWRLMQSLHGRHRVNMVRKQLYVPANHAALEDGLNKDLGVVEGKKRSAAAAAAAIAEAEDVYEDPALLAEVDHMLDTDHEFELGDPTDMVEGGRQKGKQKV